MLINKKTKGDAMMKILFARKLLKAFVRYSQPSLLKMSAHCFLWFWFIGTASKTVLLHDLQPHLII